MTSVLKVRLDVVNPVTEKYKAEGLVLMMTKSGEIMWVHSDIVKDEQWEFNKLKLPEVRRPDKVGVQTVPTTASFTEWCIIPPEDALSSRERSNN